MHAMLLFLFLFTGSSIHDFSVDGLTGGKIDFADFEGKKILIVNTASKCGMTPQYAQLEELYQEYKDRLVIIGFPANNFGNQEPGTNEEIAEFCELNYGVSFPMAAKISVNGDDIHPLYTWLTTESYNNFVDSEVTWNFQKYLIDEKGNLIGVFPPRILPMSDDIISAITG
jgi:glutathione peroxidase